jgi:perosamine synthetase
MVVHIYGLPVDMDPVIEICKKYGLKLIEDTAEQIGQSYKGKPCGSFGDISTMSFYPNKHITTGEGGMIFTDDDNLAEKCRKLRNMYFQEGKRFVHEKLGWNLRMTNIQASLGVAQLERLDEFVLKKRWIGNKYNELLKELDGIQLPLPKTNYSENIYWVYGVVLDDTIEFSASEAIKLLTKHNVGSRPFFFPIHQQPVLKKLGLFLDEKYPVAERLYQRGFYIPSGLALSEKQLQEVANTLKSIIKSK